MSTGIFGQYEGEGPNVTTNNVAVVADVGASNMASGSPNHGQGRAAPAGVTRRRQLRVSSEGAQSSTAITAGSVGGGGADQVLTNCARGIYVSTSGTLVCRFKEDTADQTFTGLLAGQYYPFAIALIRNTSTTVGGNILF